MSNRFSAPEEGHDEWVDVRMRDPDAGEWDVDAVVAEGSVEYLDLRIDPDHLAGFIDCLVEDVSASEAGRILSQVAAQHDLDVDVDAVDEVDDGSVAEPADEAGGPSARSDDREPR